MKLPRRRFLHLTAGVAALPAISRIAKAQTFPSRPITIVVGYAAGGPTDTVARILAERMKTVLGQPVLVENATGAGGSIAVGRVVRAAPDLRTDPSAALPGTIHAIIRHALWCQPIGH
jgi:tripartite-type tricarboxylate transporter receptor subunit TctC